MNKSLLSMCDITTGKKDSNDAVRDGLYPFFTCAPEPLSINDYAFDCNAILLTGNNAQGNFCINRYEGKFNAYQRTYVITAKRCYDIDYIKYSLELYLTHFKKLSHGSQTKFLTMQILESCLILDLPKNEQKIRIKILLSLDRKIALNNAINAELEKAAKLLYNYWFVQFDFPNSEGKPYRASGGAMEYNKQLKREIPKGWRVVPLSEIIIENKQALTDDEYKNALFGLDLSIMPRNTICLNQRGFANDFASNRFRLRKYDLLFGSIRPYLRKAGFAAFDGVLNSSIMNFRNKKVQDYSFALCTLTDETLFKYADMRSNSNGTRMPTINAAELLEYNLAYDQKTALAFNEQLLQYWEIISLNINQNFELTALRDFLLPLLMNGQVRVEEKGS
ncbi:MAG: restriction endonuclease subunit S [Deferribacteraceae bacterium]|jgi:type I restriction enzyme S subunit|nr:restriction endonuclease subunit S [Deferribacteraceae bacterium]